MIERKIKEASENADAVMSRSAAIFSNLASDARKALTLRSNSPAKSSLILATVHLTREVDCSMGSYEVGLYQWLWRSG